MKVIFMGTPKFATPTLQALVDAGHNVDIVVSQPDAVRDRGKKIKASPVKELAVLLGTEILQPASLKDNPEFIEKLKEYAPDIIVVAAYGRILPKEILNLPRLGCINVHASLLPRHRGAGPIQKAILDGDEKTGITIMYMAQGLDTGDILAKVKIPINGKTAGELEEVLSVAGADLLVETIEKMEKKQVVAVAQREAEATYAPMIFREDAKIDFRKTAVDIERQIRALNPKPGAYALYCGKPFKIWEAKAYQGGCRELAPGTIMAAENDGIKIATGSGVLGALKVQIPGKKPMEVKDFLRGNVIELSHVLR